MIKREQPWAQSVGVHGLLSFAGVDHRRFLVQVDIHLSISTKRCSSLKLHCVNDMCDANDERCAFAPTRFGYQGTENRGGALPTAQYAYKNAAFNAGHPQLVSSRLEITGSHQR